MGNLSLLDTTLLARLTILLTILFAVLLLGLHVVQREFDPADRYISEYALGGYGGVMTVAFFVLAVAGASLAMAILGGTGLSRLPVVGALGLWSVGLVIAGIWRTDPSLPVVPATSAGELHNQGARLAFFALTAAAVLLPLHLSAIGQLRSGLLVAVSSLFVLGAFLLFRYWPGLLGPGLTQRLLVAGALLLHVTTSFTILAPPTEDTPTPQTTFAHPGERL